MEVKRVSAFLILLLACVPAFGDDTSDPATVIRSTAKTVENEDIVD